MSDGIEMLLTRRSIGKVRPDPIPRETVEALLAAAVHAPNHHLTEPWRFVVVTGAARARIGEAHRVAIERAKPDADHAALRREAARFERAPVVVVCAVRIDGDDPIRAREDRDAVAAAIQNLLLAAHAHGLGAMWRTGVMIDEPEVHEALGFEAGDTIVGFVYLGVPDVTVPPRIRSPLDSVVRWMDS